MKRLIISIALLGIVGGLCALSLHTQQTDTQELLGLLDNMEKEYEAQNLRTCQRLSDRFPRLFEEKAKTFSLFLHHSYLSSIREVAVTLPVILREKDNSHYLAELTRCRSLLKKLAELEQPTLENIL